MSGAGTLVRLRQRVAAALVRPGVVAQAPGLTARIRFAAGDGAFDLVARDGALALEEPAGAPSVTVSAPDQAWEEALAPAPEPGFQSFTAWALRNPAFAVAGDGLAVAQGRAFLELLVESFRPPVPASAARAPRSVEGIEGRYHALPGPGGPHDAIYAESAGRGPPLLCLHTAGADARQYLGLLTDLELRERWRVIAFDLPFHGRSLPPPGWSGGPYRLDQATYRDWCLAFIEGVVREPVTLLGCSMGAAIALVLAAERPDLVAGVVALEAPVRPRGRRNPYLMHVAVHGGLHASAYVRGLMAPTSPSSDRARAAFIYSQGAPGIYDGDLAFYSDEFDGEAVARRIDGERVPTVFLTGRYDYSATLEDARALAALIQGARVVEMPDLGHFPMTENPERFRTYLLPALAALRRRATREQTAGAEP